jgi:hypothetical protein
MGVLPGMPDIFCLVPRGGYAGLFIELKKDAGEKLSEAQRKMFRWLRENNFAVHVCFSFAEATAAADSYLSRQ